MHDILCRIGMSKNGYIYGVGYHWMANPGLSDISIVFTFVAFMGKDYCTVNSISVF